MEYSVRRNKSQDDDDPFGGMKKGSIAKTLADARSDLKRMQSVPTDRSPQRPSLINPTRPFTPVHERHLFPSDDDYGSRPTSAAINSALTSHAFKESLISPNGSPRLVPLSSSPPSNTSPTSSRKDGTSSRKMSKSRSNLSKESQLEELKPEDDGIFIDGLEITGRSITLLPGQMKDMLESSQSSSQSSQSSTSNWNSIASILESLRKFKENQQSTSILELVESLFNLLHQSHYRIIGDSSSSSSSSDTSTDGPELEHSRKTKILESLFDLIDLPVDSSVLLKICHIGLRIATGGKSLVQTCKLCFKLSKIGDNDVKFADEKIMEPLLA